MASHPIMPIDSFILLSVLLVSLSKERLELDQRTEAPTDPLTGGFNRVAVATSDNAHTSGVVLPLRAAESC